MNRVRLIEFKNKIEWESRYQIYRLRRCDSSSAVWISRVHSRGYPPFLRYRRFKQKKWRFDQFFEFFGKKIYETIKVRSQNFIFNKIRFPKWCRTHRDFSSKVHDKQKKEKNELQSKHNASFFPKLYNALIP
jgi:hypothetical protein